MNTGKKEFISRQLMAWLLICAATLIPVAGAHTGQESCQYHPGSTSGTGCCVSQETKDQSRDECCTPAPAPENIPGNCGTGCVGCICSSGDVNPVPVSDNDSSSRDGGREYSVFIVSPHPVLAADVDHPPPRTMEC